MAKGGEYENEIAKLLSLWWADNQRDDIFGRSDSSGARFTQRRKKGKDTANQGGDLTFIDSIGEPLIKTWNIECKTGYGLKTKDEIIRWDVLDFLDSKQKNPVLQVFWNQCSRDADLTNRQPILIFRRNRRETCICFLKDYEEHLSDFYGSCFVPKITISIENQRLTIIKLKDFFEWIPDIKQSLIK